MQVEKIFIWEIKRHAQWRQICINSQNCHIFKHVIEKRSFVKIHSFRCEVGGTPTAA